MSQNKSYLTTKHYSSPFIADMLLEHIVPEGKIVQGDIALVKINDQDHYVNLTEVSEVDNETFIKTFAKHQALALQLSKTAMEVLQYCVAQMVPNKDIIAISISEAAEYCKYRAKSQVYRGIKELVEARVIAPSVKSAMWYINPALMFNGKRFSVIKSYIAANKTPEQTRNEFLRKDMLDVLENSANRQRISESIELLPTDL